MNSNRHTLTSRVFQCTIYGATREERDAPKRDFLPHIQRICPDRRQRAGAATAWPNRLVSAEC